ncbi:unnamed protein product [Paramecium pentaurelia]|uniref:WD40-repeat-containing domain n=1 Tax=Paramecium pentaurelia TaxID=43138 RepID=A0A8S1YJF2_9CILI|nr:unnamed protein product [Paramecium pentaurelia]
MGIVKRRQIAKIVEDMNKSTNSDDPLLVQYTEQNDLVNQLMIDNFLSLQECTFNQIKKFNPLIQNQIFEQMTKQQQQNQSNHNLIEEIKDEQNIRKITKKNFTYHLIKESSIKEQQQCNAMAFNKECSIVLVGCNQQIQVFEFKQGMMKQTQILKEHENNVITLNFMKKSNQFISGSEKDGWIIIWSLNSINNQWILQQKLKKHSVGIICLVLNENEDLFVSGGFDNKIIFWGKKNQWILEQTLDLKQRLYALSINEEQSRLIICSFETEIFILEFQQQKWIIQQKILVQQQAIRISFISNNLFTVQSFQNDLLDIYEMENQLGYIKTRGIIVMRGCGQEEECLFFPSQYIKLKSLLVIKNCQYINLIKIKENREFLVENSIQYQTSKLYGSISDDGEYLITWDQVSKEIQIRKLQES